MNLWTVTQHFSLDRVCMTFFHCFLQSVVFVCLLFVCHWCLFCVGVSRLWREMMSQNFSTIESLKKQMVEKSAVINVRFTLVLLSGSWVLFCVCVSISCVRWWRSHLSCVSDSCGIKANRHSLHRCWNTHTNTQTHAVTDTKMRSSVCVMCLSA